MRCLAAQDKEPRAYLEEMAAQYRREGWKRKSYSMVVREVRDATAAGFLIGRGEESPGRQRGQNSRGIWGRESVMWVTKTPAGSYKAQYRGPDGKIKSQTFPKGQKEQAKAWALGRRPPSAGYVG